MPAIGKAFAVSQGCGGEDRRLLQWWEEVVRAWSGRGVCYEFRFPSFEAGAAYCVSILSSRTRGRKKTIIGLEDWKSGTMGAELLMEGLRRSGLLSICWLIPRVFLHSFDPVASAS